MPDSPNNSKVLILDPSVAGDSHSHHLLALKGYTTVLKKSGLTLLSGTNVNSRFSEQDVINYPVFDYSIYDDFIHGNTGRIRRLFNNAHYNSLLHDISSSIRHILSREKLGGHDHLFLPTLDWLLYRALLEVFDKTDRSPCFHLLVMYEQANWITGGYPYGRIIDSLLDELHAGRNMFFYTETKRHGKRLGKSLDSHIHTLPFPALPFPTGHARRDNLIRVGALGGGRRDKGFRLLPEIIMKFNSTYPGENVCFIVQAGRKEDDLSIENNLLNRIPNVTLLANELSRPEYEEHFLNCDMLIFPYSNTVYQWRGSGIVNEALANSKPLVCTRNTALEEALIAGNGLCAAGAEEFTDAVIEITDNLDEYRSKAENAREIYLHSLYNNPLLNNIESFGASLVNIQ